MRQIPSHNNPICPNCGKVTSGFASGPPLLEYPTNPFIGVIAVPDKDLNLKEVIQRPRKVHCRGFYIDGNTLYEFAHFTVETVEHTGKKFIRTKRERVYSWKT